MIWTPLELIPKKCLGIDIGTSSIKIVELSRWGERRKLDNYGEITAQAFYQKTFRGFDKNTLLLSDTDISKAIKAVLDEAKIKTRRAVFSIPDFSSFFTNFELPAMTKKELPQAVIYEARRHVPLPLAEVVLDWQIIEGEADNQKKSKLKILLVAVPKEVINQYQEIAKVSNLELFCLEAEVFGLLRSLIKEPPTTFNSKSGEGEAIALIDIGAQSTTCSVVENQILKISHSFDMAGNDLTQALSKGLSVDYKEADALKRKYGISSEEFNVREICLPLIDVILRECDKVFTNFYQIKQQNIEKIIIAGSSAFLPGLKEYFQGHFKKETKIANAFPSIFYPPILQKTLKKMGPAYAIATGMALRGLE